ncbi:YlxQ family RNA-binding protein [Halalkalibacterium halodurans]|jgi:ribosomal protein L7Ae-like RNA K-turn-binding protein|uniref:BH2414 protein n=2 Tax=Halalkalibacterium halodurans TaxID=86665 RepID=Q9KA76_HALH5|nr:YlxQ family RNA-binding protein [Halalkalibacterium halodurans]MDY7222962.1 YlxQ family RNA-binding protein [Halalkalibacterium halodurans]MDY7242183.1 YlxQ family RNA-binding protein [Halalkalibacterium halodurans]MED3646209.1 YlxQ family RNA-binding protein [Halalkalibacterium halodurans]MED4080079.1 YlxQ family RNA-binding protein [Halalkalibacterium halodurans]MED4086846.1 YlxQ family RNA-binding protein [Halalkalibacterium halodurans]
MSEAKWLSLLGLAARARQLLTGEEQVVKAVQNGQVTLVILSSDAGIHTKKKLLDKCGSYQIPVKVVGNRQMLGRAIGKHERVVIGVKDAGFSRKLAALIDE